MEKIQVNLDNMESYFVKESFRTLRANLQFCGNENKVIAITSCDANEGKTSVSLMLSKSLAQADKKVVYVDCDLRKSVVATRFSEARNVKGLSEYLSGMAEKDEIICTTQFDNFDMVLSGPYCPNPVELMMKDRFADFLKQLREVYDYVIVDTPPLGLVIDCAAIAGYCDSAIMVVSVGRIRYKQAKRTKAQLEKSGCKILGIVLNHIEKRGERYYKKYNKKYYGKRYYTPYDDMK